jgi:hypothetical protein
MFLLCKQHILYVVMRVFNVVTVSSKEFIPLIKPIKIKIVSYLPWDTPLRRGGIGIGLNCGVGVGMGSGTVGWAFTWSTNRATETPIAVYNIYMFWTSVVVCSSIKPRESSGIEYLRTISSGFKVFHFKTIWLIKYSRLLEAEKLRTCCWSVPSRAHRPTIWPKFAIDPDWWFRRKSSKELSRRENDWTKIMAGCSTLETSWRETPLLETWWRENLGSHVWETCVTGGNFGLS